ncbi:MAG: hypothetical protein K6D97_08405, partial [Clostridia bacterium]|nr:hypothetical protein [Clostridia bacterium]
MFRIKNIKIRQTFLNSLKIIISILCLSILSTFFIEKYFLQLSNASSVFPEDVGDMTEDYDEVYTWEDIKVFEYSFYDGEIVKKEFFEYTKDVPQDGVKILKYLFFYWYEEDKTLHDIISDSDMFLLMSYDAEYTRWSDNVAPVLAVKKYINDAIKKGYKRDYTNILQFCLRYWHYDGDDIEEFQGQINETVRKYGIGELEDKLKETEKMDDEEQKEWFLQNIDFFKSIDREMDQLLNFMRERFATLDGQIMDILRKYDELVDIIEGNEDSKLLEKS